MDVGKLVSWELTTRPVEPARTTEAMIVGGGRCTVCFVVC